MKKLGLLTALLIILGAGAFTFYAVARDRSAKSYFPSDAEILVGDSTEEKKISVKGGTSYKTMAKGNVAFKTSEGTSRSVSDTSFVRIYGEGGGGALLFLMVFLLILMIFQIILSITII